MDSTRSAKINIGGAEHELVLTTRATKEIARRYGGLENLGEKLLKAENLPSTRLSGSSPCWRTSPSSSIT